MPDWIFDSCTVSHRCRNVQLVSKMAPHYILTVFRSFSKRFSHDPILQKTKYAPQQVTCLNTFLVYKLTACLHKRNREATNLLVYTLITVLCFLHFMIYKSKLFLKDS